MNAPWSQTYTGGRFDILDPQASQVKLLDIAAQLAKICRFGGACTTFYSVAQHSVEVAELLPPEWQGYGLLHDAHEMIVGDITSPVKQAIHAVYHRKAPLDILVRRIDAAIHHAFGLAYPLPPRIEAAVKLADLTMLATERRDLMAPTNHEWLPLPKPRDRAVLPMDWPLAERHFLSKALEIFGGAR